MNQKLKYDFFPFFYRKKDNVEVFFPVGVIVEKAAGKKLIYQYLLFFKKPKIVSRRVAERIQGFEMGFCSVIFKGQSFSEVL